MCTLFFTGFGHIYVDPWLTAKKIRIRVWFCRDIRMFKKLCSVHHTAESNSGVRIKNFGGLWLLFKGTIKQIFWLVNTIAIIGEKILSIKIEGFTKPTYKVHTGSQNLRTFWSYTVSWRNRNQIQIYIWAFWVRNFKSLKNRGKNSRETCPLMSIPQYLQQYFWHWLTYEQNWWICAHVCWCCWQSLFTTWVRGGDPYKNM